MADLVLGSWPVTAFPRHATRHHLRILAYHGVVDIDAFRRQMVFVAGHYEPVSLTDVTAALHGQAHLPDYAVWVTFDDGDPSVVENALPILLELDTRSTIFVCPGLVDTTTPFWWDIVDEALTLGESWELDGRRFGSRDLHALTGQLKAVDDDHRREIVAALADAIVQRTGLPAQRKQVTTHQLTRFVAAGGSVGNHTWDHPCLDSADDDAQNAQIIRAHEWLNERFPSPARVFAYPNGNYSPVAERALRDLDYHLGALFDHRLTPVEGNMLRLSRLRVNDSTTPARFAAILAGVHPALHSMRNRIRSR